MAKSDGCQTFGFFFDLLQMYFSEDTQPQQPFAVANLLKKKYDTKVRGGVLKKKEEKRNLHNTQVRNTPNSRITESVTARVTLIKSDDIRKD